MKMEFRRGKSTKKLSESKNRNSNINLCVCTHLPLDNHTGAVDRIMALAKNVSKNDVNVYLVNRSLTKSLSAIFVDKDKYFRIRNGQITELSYPFRIRLLIPGPLKFLQEITNRILGIVTASVMSEMVLSYALDPYLLVKLLFVCKKENIDIIQCESPIPILPSFAAKKLLNIPLVCDSHNVETDRVRSMGNVGSLYATATELMEKNGCRVCDSVFTVSETDKKTFMSWGIAENKFVIIPNSVDLNQFSTAENGERIRDKYKLRNKTVLIFHGDLLYPPNQEAIQIITDTIMPRIVEENPSTYTFIVGRNPPKISGANIITTGFVKDLHQYIAAADIAIVPLLKGGGTRIKIIEYMACGKPVVSTTKGAEGIKLKNGSDILLACCPDTQNSRTWF